jgi:hypothetical protein
LRNDVENRLRGFQQDYYYGAPKGAKRAQSALSFGLSRGKKSHLRKKSVRKNGQSAQM